LSKEFKNYLEKRLNKFDQRGETRFNEVNEEEDEEEDE